MQNNLISSPLISVRVLTYNHESYIRQCLEGIFVQKTDFPFEVIIGEDYSTDNTRGICEEFKAKYSDQINLLDFGHNVGPQENGRRTRAACRGKYIALCDGDDYWTDHYKLQKQVDFLEAKPEYIACFTNAMVLDETDNSVKKFIKHSLNERIEFETVLANSGGLYPTASIMFRNTTLEFPAFFQNVYAGDWALILMLASKGSIGYIDDTTCLYRKHMGGVYTSIEKNMELRRKMNINSIEFLHELDQYLNYTKNKEIKKRISQIAKKVILRTSNKKISKENMNYFKKLNLIDFLSLLKHALIKK